LHPWLPGRNARSSLVVGLWPNRRGFCCPQPATT